VKRLAVASTAKRLAALEHQFLDIVKMTKVRRRKLDEVAETVRIAVDELGEQRKARPEEVKRMSRDAKRSRASTTQRTD
jgi:hypothetical protein